MSAFVLPLYPVALHYGGKEDYDRWQYNYPKYDTTRRWAKVPSKELSDFLVEAFRDKLDTDE